MDNYPIVLRSSSQLAPPYYYSYTINGYTITVGANANQWLAGCASTWTIPPPGGGAAGSYFTARKLTSIHRTSDSIMLAEEPVSTLPQDLPPPVAAISPNDYADDGRWLPGSRVGNGNTITYRHNKRGNANFADGHAQIVDYNYASDTNHFDTTF